MDLEDSIKKIIEKTGLSREEIKVEIQKQIDELSGLIDEEGALVIVAKNFGIDLKEEQIASTMESDKKIQDIRPNSNVNICGRIIEIQDKRQYNQKGGGIGTFFTFFVQDKTGTMRCVVWNQNTEVYEEEGFRSNEIIRILNGFVKEGRSGGLEVHIGNKSRIQLRPDEVDHQNMPPIQQQGEKITPISELNVNLPSITIEGEITYVSPVKEFAKKSGGMGKRSSIAISDNSGSSFITFWGDHVEKMENLQLGQSIKISKLNPKYNYRDKSKIDLSATSPTEITIISSQSINPTGISAETIKTIDELLKNPGIASIEGKVQDVENIREVNLRRGGTLPVLGFIIADETGALRVNLWGEQIIADLKVNDTLRLTKLQAKLNTYSNQVEASLTKMGTVEKIEKVINSIKADIKPRSVQPANQVHYEDSKNRTMIAEIQKEEFVEFKGTIVKEIKRLTLYDGCSKCMRKITNCKCDPNNKGESEPRMILNLTIDDETGTIRITMMGKTAERLLSESTAKIKDLQDNNQLEDFLKERNKILLGKEFIFKGKAKYSSYSEKYEVNVNYFEELDVSRENERLIQLIEAGL